MPDDEPLGMREPRLQPRRPQPGGRGADDDIGPHDLLGLRKQTDFQVLAFGKAFLDEVRTFGGFLQRAHDAPGAGRRQRRDGHHRPGAPRVVHHLGDLALGLRVGVADHRVHAVQHRARGPGAADHAAAEQADRLHAVHAAHPRFTSLSFLRTSSGPRMRAPIAVRIVAARSTSAPLLASTPRERNRLSSSPTRTLPPASAAMAA